MFYFGLVADSFAKTFSDSICINVEDTSNIKRNVCIEM